jgi:quinolinate synthase
MCRYVLGRPEESFIVGTETGILHRLQKENPGKQFFPLLESAVCPNMKKTTLEKVLWSLHENQTIVRVEEPIASRARKSIEAMLAIS